jgi:histidinol-phosphate aminotransferase
VGAAVGAALLERAPGSSLAEGSLPPGTPERVIQLNANENPLGPSEAAVRAIEASPRAAARYPDAADDAAREAIARHLRIHKDQVQLGCGSSQILQMADAAFLGPDKNVVAAEPTFEAVLSYAAVIHARPVKIPLTADFRHDLPAMAAACDARTGLVYICNPNNPTGTLVSGQELGAFLDRVPPSTIVLVDEAYHHFVEDPAYASALGLLDRHPNLIVARTFSKIYGLAGMRLGFSAASRAVTEQLSSQASWDNVNAAVLAAAVASLNDERLVPERRALLNENRRWLCGELKKDGRRTIPSEANFVMIHVGGDVAPVIRSFRERGILVGRKFPSMPDWLRISIGKREEMAAFLAALREIVPARERAA